MIYTLIYKGLTVTLAPDSTPGAFESRRGAKDAWTFCLVRGENNYERIGKKTSVALPGEDSWKTLHEGNEICYSGCAIEHTRYLGHGDGGPMNVPFKCFWQLADNGKFRRRAIACMCMPYRVRLYIFDDFMCCFDTALVIYPDYRASLSTYSQ